MDFTKRYIVEPGKTVSLGDIGTDRTAGVKSKKEAADLLEQNTQRLRELEYLLYAENRHALLIILQAMDAGGKDGTIRHVMGPLNPQSCHVTSFKAPTPEELDHDFLWRIHKAVPQKGRIAIFNRSHYEDVLIVRVHNLVEKSIWSKRYDQINHFEKMLSESNIHILKFFLHISKEEQKERFLARLDKPHKHWKFAAADLEERKYWDDYQRAYEEAIGRTSTEHAPWFIIPADKKWYRNLAVSEIIEQKLESLDMKFPQPLEDIEALRKRLEED